VFAEIGSKVVRRWISVAGTVVTVASLALLVLTDSRYWVWLLVGGLVILVFVLAWTLRDAQSTQVDHRAQLKPLLEAAAERLEHLGLSAAHNNPQWFLSQYIERSNSTYSLIDASLGPKLADDFSHVHVPGLGVGRMQAEAVEKATFVRDLAGKLDSLPIMGDWQP
jgi:hypothetical protein